MIAQNLISELIIPLKKTDTGEKALSIMNELKVSHLPIIENKKNWGLISEEDIIDFNNLKEILGKQKLTLNKTSVLSNQHIYDVIKVFSQLSLSILPVITQDNEYIGTITSDNIIYYFSTLSAINETGGVMILDMPINDYSLSDITRMIESNDGKILSVYTHTYPNSTKIEVTIKINKTDLRHIIATFERFEYNVKAYYQESEYTDDLKNHFDSLINYLDI